MRMVGEIRGVHESDWAAMARVAELLGIWTPETVRKWVRRTEIDGGKQAGTTSEDSAEIKRLKRENAELRRANTILKAGGCRSESASDTAFHEHLARWRFGRIVAWLTTS